MGSGFDTVGAPVRRTDVDVDDMGVFVDRLAAAGSDRATAQAAAQVRREIEAGTVPPGLRRLAEALAASVAGPPAPRRPADEPAGVVEATSVANLVVLDEHGPEAVAAAVAALVTAGRRVVVTGRDASVLGPVRTALLAGVADRVSPRLPDMLPAELRELRKLLAGDNPSRRAREGQQLPAESALPDPELVATLCRQTRGLPGTSSAGLLDGMLDGADPERLAAIGDVARRVRATLDALGPDRDGSWTRSLLSELVVQRHRTVFDSLREDVAQAAELAAALTDTPKVTFLEPLSPEGVQALFAYLNYLRAGGRPRSFFRTAEQRGVQPVLARILVGGEPPQTAAHIELVLRHRELAVRRERVERHCIQIGVPPMRFSGGLAALAADLDEVAAAARAVAALRHDVLFLRTDSPIPPPDPDDAEQIADEIIAFVDHAPALDAGRELQRLADQLSGTVPAGTAAPEHQEAVAALRRADAAGYAEAVDDLGAARRQERDGRRQDALLSRLRSAAPALATAWTAHPEAGFGLVCFVPADALLAQLPPADSADVVVVLGAADLGVERLLLTAAAPRLVAVVAPGERTERAPSLITVMRKAGALVIPGGVPGGPTGADVLPLARKVPTPREAQVG